MQTEGAMGALLGTVLENPKLLQGLLRMLGPEDGEETEEKAPQSTTPLPALQTAPEVLVEPAPALAQRQVNSDRERRRALLLALKPYLRPERAEKVEAVLSLLDGMELLQRKKGHREERGGI